MNTIMIETFEQRPMIAGRKELLLISFPETQTVKDLRIYPSQTFQPVPVTGHQDPYSIRVAGHLPNLPLLIGVSAQPLHARVDIRLALTAGDLHLEAARSFPVSMAPFTSLRLPEVSEEVKAQTLSRSQALVEKFYPRELKFFPLISTLFLVELEKYQEELRSYDWKRRLQDLFFPTPRDPLFNIGMALMGENLTAMRGAGPLTGKMTPLVIQMALRLNQIVKERATAIRWLRESGQGMQAFEEELATLGQQAGLPVDLAIELAKESLAEQAAPLRSAAQPPE